VNTIQLKGECCSFQRWMLLISKVDAIQFKGECYPVQRWMLFSSKVN